MSQEKAPKKFTKFLYECSEIDSYFRERQIKNALQAMSKPEISSWEEKHRMENMLHSDDRGGGQGTEWFYRKTDIFMLYFEVKTPMTRGEAEDLTGLWRLECLNS